MSDELLTRRACSVILTINMAVLLAVIIVLRLRRRTQARSRLDEKATVIIVLVFGVLVAPTAFGQGVLDIVTQLARGISQSGSP
jgi:preprotein translocase subunit SecY